MQYTVGTLLLLVVPLVRSDRATPWQATVLLAVSSRTTPAPAGRASVAVRFAVRWLPILVWGTPAIAVVALIELAVVATRADRTSLTGLIVRTATVIHDRLEELPTDSPLPGPVADTAPDPIPQSPEPWPPHSV